MIRAKYQSTFSKRNRHSTRNQQEDMEKKKVYFPNLDGWRFVAFLGVFYHHSFQTQNTIILDDPIYRALKSTTSNGELGVDFFFVLSGFLIIYLLITEKQLTGKIDLRNFYIRRVLRIFPLYYLCVFFGFVIFPLLKSFLGAVPDESANPILYSVFLGNLDIVSNAAMPDSGVLGILWSVAIEEQFYLVVPLLLMVIPTKYYPSLFVVVIVISFVMRGLNIDNYFYIKFHTFSSIGNLAVGGLAANYSATRPDFIRFFAELRPVFILALYVFTIVLLVFRAEIFAVSALKVFEAIIFSLAFGMIILEQNNSRRSLFKMSNNRLFTRLGRYTYGLYCLHLLAALIVLTIGSKLGINTQLWQVVIIEMPLMLIISIALAFLSYEFYEKRFLKLKDRFSVIVKGSAA